jgi:hypothetical protein
LNIDDSTSVLEGRISSLPSLSVTATNLDEK